ATGEKGKLLRVGVDMRVTIARILGDVEIDLRFGLRCFRKACSGAQDGSNGCRAHQCITSRQHGELPLLLYLYAGLHPKHAAFVPSSQGCKTQMSAIGPKRTWLLREFAFAVAIGGKADMAVCAAHVCF